LGRILPLVLLLGVSRNLSQRRSVGEMQSWDRRGLEQEGAAGTCLPPGVLGCGAARGGPTTALQRHFGISMSRAGDGTWAHGREEMISEIPAVSSGPDGSGLCRFLGAAQGPLLPGTPHLQGKLRHGQPAAQQEPPRRWQRRLLPGASSPSPPGPGESGKRKIHLH